MSRADFNLAKSTIPLHSDDDEVDEGQHDEQHHDQHDDHHHQQYNEGSDDHSFPQSPHTDLPTGLSPVPSLHLVYK